MRAGLRQRRHEEEEESVFISMTDMTVGFLFIVILLLAFFATQIAPGEMVPKRQLDERDDRIAVLEEELAIFEGSKNDSLTRVLERLKELEAQRHETDAELARLRSLLTALRVELRVAPDDDLLAEVRLLKQRQEGNPIAVYNATAENSRRELVERIRSRIVAADSSIAVNLSERGDALQFRGEGLFAKRAEEPSPEGRKRMEIIAGVIAQEIGCFVFSEAVGPQTECNPHSVLLDAIQIEGHTDSDGTDNYNMTLGALRGSSVFGIMVRTREDLLNFDNLQGQPVLMVAGFGEGRPIADEAIEGGKDANRRIDIRFLIFSPTNEQTIPRNLADIARLRDLLSGTSQE
ncbi:MAG: OmpA family protein [Paracoccaceae bacterium]